jgi:hypothetical protein
MAVTTSRKFFAYSRHIKCERMSHIAILNHLRKYLNVSTLTALILQNRILCSVVFGFTSKPIPTILSCIPCRTTHFPLSGIMRSRDFNPHPGSVRDSKLSPSSPAASGLITRYSVNTDANRTHFHDREIHYETMYHPRRTGFHRACSLRLDAAHIFSTGVGTALTRCCNGLMMATPGPEAVYPELPGRSPWTPMTLCRGCATKAEAPCPPW